MFEDWTRNLANGCGCSGNCSVNSTCQACSTSMDYQINFSEDYNVSENGKNLRFFEVAIRNEMFSYNFYVLSYEVEKE